MSVGALDADSNERAWYTNFGSWVDVYARETDVVNPLPRQQLPLRRGLHEGESTTFPTGLAK